MKRIIIDPGHGGSDTGATYKGYFEKTYNLTIALLVKAALESRYEVDISLTRIADKTVSLKQRTDFANAKDADFYLSIHNNAAGGRGFESFIYNRTVPAETVRIQNVIHNTIASTVLNKYKIPNRGKKRANFHVLRETKMHALLLEVLFVDNNIDLNLLNNSVFIKDVSMAIAEGTASALNLPKKTPPPSLGLYKVIAGSFTSRENAEVRAEFLASKGFDSFITSLVIKGTTYYRVQAGAFSEKSNAEELVAKLKTIGIDSFIITEGTVEPPAPEPEPEPEPEPDVGYPIAGDSALAAAHLNNYARSVNPEAPLLGAYYLVHSKRYGIRGDIAFAQALHETNFFRFTGDVTPEQNNYAGIGATGGGAKGASFDTPSDGVLAHIQHLYAYSSKDPIPAGEKVVDPRFSLVTRGSATTWQALNGKWAVPGTTYGEMILTLYKKMVQSSISDMETTIEKLNKLLTEITI
ncbi:N-acetylmuramoyl-L-alanine amidase [Guptibacillus algicola]|uniref:N-acetylmuramoyl-L-alanine amidase n=1 Tax=Guptibacillus algicola TaxID=225844 RepID=UPI001CD666D4|nr:N-acetylmuramoyl-L-alanine amidase [Alkalihalobacillus algicola]MCA0986606.1 N-acetylmuramoyl-L-alanine amidase [Alkalihalobacillus algicola]